jgi:hypothetical protein
LLKSNAVKCKVKYSESGALLQGKLFDDKGNRMGPTFSSKSGIRYRFYFSTALRGRKHKAGSVTRVSAREIEDIVAGAVRKEFALPNILGQAVSERIEQVVLGKTLVRITFRSESQADGSLPTAIEIPWTPAKHTPAHLQAVPHRNTDQKLLQAVVRSRAWLADLKSCRYASIEELAESVKIHPKVVRQALRLAFLSPGVTSSILEEDGADRLTVRQIPKRLPLAWSVHRELCG